MLKNRTRYLLYALFALVLVLPAPIFAKIGVGIGTGRIEVDEILKPGTIYQLPSLNVINTGDEAGTYQVGVEYHYEQEERQPKKEWFTFKPEKFELKPGENKTVDISLTLPIKTKPGKYFAYLKGYPVTGDPSGGGAVIGVAAAAKLYFTVAPANIFVGIYYRILTFWQNNLPWTNIAALVTVFSILVVVFRKNFNLQLSVAKKKTADDQEPSKNE